jgi:hypothetical protein
MRFLTLSLSLSLTLSLSLPGQGRSPLAARRSPPGCRIDTNATWYKKQREFLDDSKHDWSNDSLRTALLRASGVSMVGPLPVQVGVQIAGRDSFPMTMDDPAAMIGALRRAGRGSVWPTKSVVGAAGTRGVWTLALRDSAFANMAMHRMMEAGPAEALGADVATLDDRLRLARGRKQIFGTQFVIGDKGRVALAPMEDSAHADMRREGAGLPPFRVSLCVAQQR